MISLYGEIVHPGSYSIVQGVTNEQKENLEKLFDADKMPKFEGKVILPV